MGHNHVVSGNSKSTGIPHVDGVVNGTLGFGVSQHGIRAKVNNTLGARWVCL